MADQSAIEWTDSTFNPWIGCTKVSPGCDHCYAEISTPSRVVGVEWGSGKPRQRTSPENWKLPLRWNAQAFAQCNACGWRGEAKRCVSVPHPDDQMPTRGCPSCRAAGVRDARRRVFCASLADWLDKDVPVEWLVDLLDVVRLTPNIDWLLLTKRIGNFAKRLDNAAHQAREQSQHDLATWLFGWLSGDAPANVWIGATICNQAEADRDIPKLLATPAAVRFLSIEPMLGPVNLNRVCDRTGSRGLWINSIEAREANPAHEELVALLGPDYPYNRIDWVISGGESGPNARPMHPDWVRSLRDQCAAADVPFLFKQWGEWEPRDEWSGHQGGGRFERQTAVMLDGSPCSHDEVPQDVGAHRMAWVGKKAAGRMLDGVLHHAFPEVRA